MNLLLEWWAVVWQLYLAALKTGQDLGGLTMWLVWTMSTVAAFAAMVVAPLVIVVKLIALAFVLALKAALGLLIVGSLVEVSGAWHRHESSQTAALPLPTCASSQEQPKPQLNGAFPPPSIASQSPSIP